MGEIETLDDYWVYATRLPFPVSVNHAFSTASPDPLPCKQNHRVHRLRLLFLASTSFMPGVARSLSLRSAFALFAGQVGKKISSRGWVQITKLWFLLPSDLEKPLGGGGVSTYTVASFLSLITSKWCSHGGELMVNRCPSNQNATQNLTSMLHQGKRCLPNPDGAFIS